MLERALAADARPATPARRPARAGSAPAGWPGAFSSRVGQSPRRRRHQRDRLRRAPPPGARTASCRRAGRGQLRRRRRSTREQRAGAPPRPAAAARDSGASGAATAAASSAREVAGHAARPSPRRTGRCRTRTLPCSAPPCSARLQRQVELGGAAVRRRSGSARSTRPGELHCPAARSAGRASPGTAACGSRSRSGPELLDQLLERHVLVRVGVQRGLAHPAPAARRSCGSPDRSGAQHQRVDEEADQLLDLRRGCGRRSACRPRRRPAPRVARQQRPGRRRAAP